VTMRFWWELAFSSVLLLFPRERELSLDCD
jgi:hypothetical protein